MASPNEIAKNIALLEKQKATTKNSVAKKVIDSKIEKLKKELTEANKKTTGTKATITKAKEKVAEMSSKEFSELISRLKQKPEFAFLKGMSKGKIVDDVKRVAKPKGWRIAGKLGEKRRPTASEIKKGVARNGSSVYYEARPIRSDVSREVRLAGGGSVATFKLTPLVSLDNRGLLTPEYKASKTISSTYDKAVSEAEQMLSSNSSFVEVQVVKVGATALKSKKVAVVTKEGTRKLATGGSLSSKSKYVPNRMISEISVERNGKETIIDGADVIDGMYVKKGVKFAGGGGVSYSEITLKCDYPKFKRRPAHTTYYKIDTSKEIKVGGMGEKGYELIFKDGNKSNVVISERQIKDLLNGKTIELSGAKVSISDKFAGGGGVDSSRMYGFLTDDLKELELAISENDNERIERFFSYWNAHLKSLKTSTNSRMYGFLVDDLKELEVAINENDSERIERFFSYWNAHLKSLKMATGGGVEDEGVNLFEEPDNIPAKVMAILDKYEDAFMDEDFEGLNECNKALKKVGYTMDVGMGGEALNLRKIGQKPKYGKGGGLTGAELEYKSDYYDEIMAILKDNIHLFEKIYDRYPSTETIEQDKRLNKLVLDNLKSIHSIALQSREKLLSFSKKNDATAKAKGVYEYAHGGSPEADMDDDGVTRGFFEDEAYTYAGGGNFDYYDGAGARTLDKLSLEDLKFQLKHTTKPHETDRIKYLKEMIAKKEGSKFAGGGGIYSSDNVYSVKVFANGKIVEEKNIRARNQREANEMTEDMDSLFTKKYGDHSVKVELASSKHAHGGTMGEMHRTME